MSEPQPIEAKHPERHAAFWITLARSVLALILQPEKSRPFLINFVGVFWLAAGIMSLRWGVGGERARRTSIVALTGLVHVFEGFRTGPDHHRQPITRRKDGLGFGPR